MEIYNFEELDGEFGTGFGIKKLMELFYEIA